MLSVVILGVAITMLRVFMLDVVMLSVVTPMEGLSSLVLYILTGLGKLLHSGRLRLYSQAQDQAGKACQRKSTLSF
jgi:hypothetical protein